MQTEHNDPLEWLLVQGRPRSERVENYEDALRMILHLQQGSGRKRRRLLLIGEIAHKALGGDLWQ